MEPKGRNRQILEWALAVAVAGLLFYLVYRMIGEPYQVSDNHGTHHLEKGDLIWLDSEPYRHKSESSELGDIDLAGPGDLVYFEFSEDDSQLPLTGLARIAGLPGDTVKIYNGTTFINGKALDFSETEIKRYNMVLSDLVKEKNFRQSFKIAEIFKWEIDSSLAETRIEISTIEKNAIYIAGMMPVESMNQVVESGRNPRIFPNGLDDQNADNYGPVVVPSAGDSIHWHPYWQELLAESPAIVKRQPDSLIKVFSEDHYFLLVDYRSKGNDSRFFGTIPQSRIKSVLE